MERPGGAKIAGSIFFYGLVDPKKDFRVYITGMGFRPMGLPMFTPFCNDINK
jgi:hypothetical protein